MSKRALKPVELDLDAPGKDISHLFASSLSPAHDTRHQESLHVERLLDNPYQPRTHMNQESLEELARVIGGQGFQGVLVARPHPERRGYYQLTAGHRRREAARLAGLGALPVIVRDLSDEEMVTLAVTENIQREDLTPLEEGRIYLLMNREMGYKLEQIAREIGKTIGYVYNRVRVAKAPPDVQALVEEKPDSLRAVANLIKVGSESERAEIIGALLAGEITTDDIPLYIGNLRAATQKAEGLNWAKPKNRQERVAEGNLSLGGDGDGAATDKLPEAEPHLMQPLAAEARAGNGTLGDVESRRPDTKSDANLPNLPHSGSADPSAPLQPATVLIDGVETLIERERGLRDLADLYRKSDPAYAQRIRQTEAQARSSRARRSKLSRILSMLQAFSDGVEDNRTLSREECLDLAIISLFVGRLCERLGIDKNNV